MELMAGGRYGTNDVAVHPPVATAVKLLVEVQRYGTAVAVQRCGVGDSEKEETPLTLVQLHMGNGDTPHPSVRWRSLSDAAEFRTTAWRSPDPGDGGGAHAPTVAAAEATLPPRPRGRLRLPRAMAGSRARRWRVRARQEKRTAQVEIKASMGRHHVELDAREGGHRRVISKKGMEGIHRWPSWEGAAGPGE